MRKIERTIYKFEELEKEVQKKLIEKERDAQREFYCDYTLHDDMGAKASDLINDYFGITSDHLYTYYDLSYSQGSGAMVEFDINIEDLNNKYKIFSDEEIRFLTDKGIVNTIEIRHNNNHYYHEYTFGITNYYYNKWDFEDIENDYEISNFDFNTLEDRFYKWIDTYNIHYTKSPFITDIINMNKELTKYGYECIEYYWNCDDEEIIQYLTENEYYSDGEIYLGVE